MSANGIAGADATFDYLIVGAGTAGCVLANRLSADPTIRVGLIEAGPSDKRFKVRVPAAVAAAIGDPAIGWGYKSVPQRHLNGRQIPIPRGRVLGGCSSINGMVYFRGHPRDFDGWADCRSTQQPRPGFARLPGCARASSGGSELSRGSRGYAPSSCWSHARTPAARDTGLQQPAGR